MFTDWENFPDSYGSVRGEVPNYQAGQQNGGVLPQTLGEIFFLGNLKKREVNHILKVHFLSGAENVSVSAD